MTCFDPSTSPLAGMSSTDVQAALTAAQSAYAQLAAGSKVVTVSYTQGDGSKNVTYKAPDLGTLLNFIRLCQAQLGIISRPRRPIRVIF